MENPTRRGSKPDLNVVPQTRYGGWAAARLIARRADLAPQTGREWHKIELLASFTYEQI